MRGPSDPRRAALAVGLLLAGWVLAHPAPTRAETQDPRLGPPGLNAGGPEVEAIVDATRTESGALGVTLRVSKIRDPRMAFLQKGSNDQYTFHDVSFSDGNGAVIPHTMRGQRYHLDPFAGDTVVATYSVVPGGIGRHGHQGHLDSDHATFDGRIFLRPTHAQSVSRVRVRFDTPEGWVVAAPFHQEGDWYTLDEFRADIAYEVLGKTCVGLGRFDVATRRFGAMPVRVYSYSGFEPDHKNVLNDHVFRIVGWFHEQFGFDAHTPYVVVYVPQQGGDRVFGGSFANGTCYENPDARLRSWQLLAHRIGHSIDEYNPSGMTLRDTEDHWFMEGWASYIEVVATEATGIAGNEKYWNELYDRYQRIRAAKPGYDVPLADEQRITSSDAREFLHYTKGPLVLRMLDHWMRERSGKSMEEFVGAMWPRYGFQHAGFPLRDELERFTGDSYDDFWAVFVDRPGVVIPVWPGFVEPDPSAPRGGGPVAARVAGEPISGNYLYYLARDGGFARYRDIQAFVIQEVERRRRLRAAGVHFFSQQEEGFLYSLSPARRVEIASAERDYAERFFAEPPSGVSAHRAGTGEMPAVRKFRSSEWTPELDTEAGRMFEELLSAEAGYLDDLVSSGVSALTLRVFPRTRNKTMTKQKGSGRDQLAIASHDHVEARTRWNRPRDAAQLVVLDGDRLLVKKSVHIDPGQTYVSTSFYREPLPPGERILRFQIRSADRILIERAFWQR